MKGIKLYTVLWATFFFSSASSQSLENIGDQEPLSVSGSISARLQFFEAEGRPSNREPFSWYLEGNPVLTVYGITLPFSFVISEQQRDFRQPFNRFGVSPYYKWIKAHLGYRNLNWSTYSLAGHTITGAGVEMTPGKFRLGFMHGRLLKAIKERDNTETSIKVQTPAYQRTGTSVKIGYGTENNYVDLIFLYAQDDETSLSTEPVSLNITPAENLVATLVTRQVFKKNWILEAEIAQSIYTPDHRLNEIDSSNNRMLKLFSFLIKEQPGTSVNTAISSSLGYQGQRFGMKVKYLRVEPEFRSLGAYYFLTDLQNITVEPSLKLLKNKLLVGGSYGIQVDNLGENKKARTKRKIGSIRINYTPSSKYNLNIFYSNYGIGQSSGVVQLDTITEVSQTNHQLSITQNLAFHGERLMHNILLNMTYQKLEDRNPNTAVFSTYDSQILNGNYFVTYTPWKVSASVGYMFTIFDLTNNETAVNGPTLSLRKTFLENKLSLGVNGSSFLNKVNAEATNRIKTASLNLNYRLDKHHRLGLKYYYNHSQAQSASAQSFTEMKGDIRYVYTF